MIWLLRKGMKIGDITSMIVPYPALGEISERTRTLCWVAPEITVLGKE